MTAVIPPRADQFASFILRVSDELASMGGTAELTSVRYVQDAAHVTLGITDGGAAQRIAELMHLDETGRGDDPWQRKWTGRYGFFTVAVYAARDVLPAARVPLLHSGDVTEDAA